MTKKFTKKNIILVSMVLIAILGIGLYANMIKLPITNNVHLQYAIDFADDRVLMGASHNVFVGKVIEQIGNKSFDNTPETQFAVEVILNIKGDLQGTVVVSQSGGYKNGVLYLVSGGDVVAPADIIKNGDQLLLPGSTYIFATRYDSKENWYGLIPHSNGKKLLSQNASLDKSQLEALVWSDEKVLKLQEAYKNEILLEDDIRMNNARNSYQSLQEKN